MTPLRCMARQNSRKSELRQRQVSDASVGLGRRASALDGVTEEAAGAGAGGLGLSLGWAAGRGRWFYIIPA